MDFRFDCANCCVRHETLCGLMLRTDMLILILAYQYPKEIKSYIICKSVISLFCLNGTDTVYVHLAVCGEQLYDWAFMCITNFMNSLHMNGTERSGTLLKMLTSSTINLIAFNHACFILTSYAAVLKCS